MTRTVEIRYFASLREASGRSQETRATECVDVRSLVDELCQVYGFRLSATYIKVAVNGNWSSPECPIGEGDQIVLMPPVAGG